MRNLLLFMLAATVAVGCSQESVDELTNSPAVEGRSLVVSLDEEGDETRIQLNEAQKTVWNEGDLVSVFYRSTVNEQWQFQGKTGDRTGNILPVDSSIVPPATGNDITVVYPYNEGYFYNSDTKNVQASLPTEQTYLKDSYGLDGNIMVSSSEYNQITLKSVCGWLKLQLTGAGEEIESITVRGNSGEQLAGELYINTADATSTLASQLTESDDDSEVSGTLVRPGTILTEVTLNCLDGSSPTEKGVALGAEATSFYIALPPQTFAKGITVEITDTTNFTMTQSTDKEVVIERNHIKPMAAFKFVNPNNPNPANNEIWYKSIDGNKTAPYRYPSDTNSLVSNTYSEDLGYWILEYKYDISKIDVETFMSCTKFTEIVLPDSITTINEDAFAGTSNLKKIHLPANLKLIQYQAFYSSAVSEIHIEDLDAWCGISMGDKSFGGSYSLYIDNKPLTNVEIPENIASLSYRAFWHCKSVEHLKLHDNFTTIGGYAFNGNTNLQTVDLGDSIEEIGRFSFAFCDKLTTITIPESVTKIGDSAFKGCSSLSGIYCESTTPPEIYDWSDNDELWIAFDDIADNALIYVPAESVDKYKTASGWSRYEDIIVGYNFETGEIVDTTKPANNEIWYTNGSTTEPTVPYVDNIDISSTFGTSIESNTYDAAKRCWVMSFYGDLTKIGNNAFKFCDTLTSIILPNSIKTIGDSAFQGCYNIATLNIPEGVTSIGQNAFKSCQSLTSVTIPDSVTSIGVSAFETCDDIKEFKGKYATDNGRCLVKDNTIIAYAEASGTTYTIPNGVTTIGDNVFLSCTKLTSVVIPNGVTTIKSGAFYDCRSLISITIPNSVTTIESAAIRFCTSLTSVTIPASVTSVGAWAFSECYSLKEVYCKATIPPTGGRDMFYYNASERKIYVPSASVSTYKAAKYWSDYASNIFEEE